MSEPTTDPQAPPNRIRGLILDYGEVLCHRPSAKQLEQIAAAAGLDLETFTGRYHNVRNDYDRGDLTPHDYWSKVVSDSNLLTDELLDTLRHWDVEMWSELDPAMLEWLRDLRAAGFKTALLSNMHTDMALYARRVFDWLAPLDSVILSCEVRVIKPQCAIYERSLAALELQPFQACFIDDRHANIQAARDLGLTALQFHSIESLRNDLALLKIPVLPRESA